MEYDKNTQMLAEMLLKRFGTIVLTTKQVATMLDKSEISLKQDRSNGTGIPYSKIGSLVRYSVLDVADYLTQTKVK